MIWKGGDKGMWSQTGWWGIVNEQWGFCLHPVCSKAALFPASSPIAAIEYVESGPHLLVPLKRRK